MKKKAWWKVKGTIKRRWCKLLMAEKTEDLWNVFYSRKMMREKMKEIGAWAVEYERDYGRCGSMTQFNYLDRQGNPILTVWVNNDVKFREDQ